MIKRINLDVNRFVCERLCTERTNKNKIRTFSCERNPNLEYYLKQHAWFEDKNNICAHYLIKDGDKVVLYFSLKTAMVIDAKKNTEVSCRSIEVDSTCAAVELVQFCVNDTYKKRIDKKQWYRNGFSLGQYLFFRYVLPKVYEIGKIIGLQYFYLFAADSTEDRTLVNYYNQKLFFRERLNSKRFIRPCYDDGCTFMYMTYADVSALYQQYIKTGK